MKKAATHQGNDSSSLRTEKSIKLKRQTQKEKVLEAFINEGNTGFYQIEAYQTFQVTCLHSYISNLEKQGVRFNRKWIAHKNIDGGQTPFMRYWIADDESLKKAISIVNFLRAKRGMHPIPPSDYFNLPNKAA